MEKPLFRALSSMHQGSIIQNAARRIVLISPGVRKSVASVIAEKCQVLGAENILVCLDFNENTLRMGYGDIEAVAILQKAGVETRVSRGFRSSFLIVDDEGWVFTPTALYLEPEPQSNETPNAMRLTQEQIDLVLFRVFPPERERQAQALPEEQRSAVLNQAYDAGEFALEEDEFERVSKEIELAPPVKFDTQRQVRVFQPYLQYVEMELHGASIQSHRVQIPPEMQALGAGDRLQGRLKTSFQLISRESALSSKTLEDELEKLRKDFTRSIGKNQRVILKGKRAIFDTRIQEFRQRLGIHQEKLKTELQSELDKSRDEVVAYYLPIVQKTPPDGLIGQLLSPKPSEDDCRRWLKRCLARCFPEASKLLTKMVLDVRFKDVTYETLNQPDFLESLKKAYGEHNWDKPYNEFRAMGESTDEPGSSPRPV